MPIAPPAAETTNVSPGFTAATRRTPHQATKPGWPRTPSSWSSSPSSGTATNESPGTTWCVCQRLPPWTRSPARQAGCREASTSPTKPPV
ncbi:hypothetical protein ACFJIY_15145 [Pimelobacter simplex]|uniref:hypothetical protein n=1 Tax=Nocardioides simplex TaxID=2045 RepID=UPI00366E5A13